MHQKQVLKQNRGIQILTLFTFVQDSFDLLMSTVVKIEPFSVMKIKPLFSKYLLN